MKTGKLMKFPRQAGDVQAYMYQEAGLYRASLYVLSGGVRSREPVQTFEDTDEATVLAEVRAWIAAHYPRPG
jgi:hypothetical protein